MALDITSYILGKASGGGGGGTLQEKTQEITSASQVITPDEGYDGMSSFTVGGISSGVDANISASNIKRGVTILGVTGTYGSEVIPPDAGTLVNIVVGTLPTKTTYTEGDALDLAGCVILANFSNGYQYDVTTDCTFTCNDPVTFFDTKIVVSYTNNNVTKTLDIPITVEGEPVQAPVTTLALYHLDGNLKDEVSGETATGTYTSKPGKFNLADAGVASTGADLGKIRLTLSQLATGKYTIEFWAKYISTGSDYSPAGVTTNNSSSRLFYQTGITGNGLRLSFYSSSPTVVYKPSSWVASDWHHYAATYNEGVGTTFIDGKLSVIGTIDVSTNNAAISKFAFWSPQYAFDEVLFCNEVKYVADFEPPHAPYYLANGGE